LPESYNYIACFLTLACNLGCSYCINSLSAKGFPKRKMLSSRGWIEGLNRISCTTDLPVTLQGGEPSLHPGFVRIINGIKKTLNIDILTNLSFDTDEFIDKVDPARLSREAPYPNIRVSYHPEQMDLEKTAKKAVKLRSAGFSVGIFTILHPQYKKETAEAKKRCRDLGIDFRTKEFLGELNGKVYGSYFYPQAVYSAERKNCSCRTSELILDPAGDIFRCHRDLYKGVSPVANLLDRSLKIKDIFRQCANFGDCNPCDVKIKTNRLQIFGHHSVEIKKIK